jgi:hypothetical protein
MKMGQSAGVAAPRRTREGAPGALRRTRLAPVYGRLSVSAMDRSLRGSSARPTGPYTAPRRRPHTACRHAPSDARATCSLACGRGQLAVLAGYQCAEDSAMTLQRCCLLVLPSFLCKSSRAEPMPFVPQMP